MKNAILISVLAGALAGSGGAMLTQSLSPSTTVASAQEPAGLFPDQPSGANEALIEQVAELKRANDELRLRLASLEERASNTGRTAVAGEDSEELAELQAQVLELAAALKNPMSAQSTGLRNAVAVALEQIEAQDEAERQREREEREARRMDERMVEYTKKLGLDQIQAKSMRKVLVESEAKRNEMFTSMREGNMDRGDIRTVFNEQREATNIALQNILTPLQMEDYGEMDQGGFRGMRGMGGGGGGRGGGRGN